MENTSKKRKRDNDIPRITYSAGPRTFERLFKEDSLEETKDVVRRKLGLSSAAVVRLTQLRESTSIDLEDDDDFEAFYAHAHTTQSVHVSVTVENPSVAGPSSGPPTGSDPKPADTTTNVGIRSPLPPRNTVAQDNSTPGLANSAEPTQPSAVISSGLSVAVGGTSEPNPKRRKVVATKGRKSAPTAPEQPPPQPDANAPSNVNKADKPKSQPRKKKTPAKDSASVAPMDPVTPASPDVGIQLEQSDVGAVSGSSLAPLVAVGVELPLPAENATAPKPKKPRKRKTVAGEGETPPTIQGSNSANDASLSSKNPKSTKQACKEVEISQPEGTVEDVPAQKMPTKKKADASDPSAGVEVDEAPKKRKKAKRKGNETVTVGEDPVPLVADADAMNVDTQPLNNAAPASGQEVSLVDGNAKTSKSKKTKRAAPALSNLNMAATVQAAVRQVLGGKPMSQPANILEIQDVTADSNVRPDDEAISSLNGEQNTAPSGDTPVTISITPLTSKMSKQAVKEPLCPICERAPLHLRYQCPIVVAGPDSIERRLLEMLEKPTKSTEETIKGLQLMLDKTQRRMPQGSRSVQYQEQNFIQTHTPATSGILGKPIAAPVITFLPKQTVVHDESSDESTNESTDGDRSALNMVRNKAMDFPTIISSKSAAVIDASEAHLEAIIRGPAQRRIRAIDLASPSPSDDDRSPEKVVLEEEAIVRKKPLPRKRRLRQESDSSSDDRGHPGDMTDDDSPSVSSDGGHGGHISFREVDDMGSSVPPDRTADDVLSDALSAGATVCSLAQKATVSAALSQDGMSSHDPPTLLPLERRLGNSPPNVGTPDDHDTIESPDTSSSTDQVLLTSPIEAVDIRNPQNMQPAPLGASPLIRSMKTRQGGLPSHMHKLNSLDSRPRTQPAPGQVETNGNLTPGARASESQPANQSGKRLTRLTSTPQLLTQIKTPATKAKAPRKAPTKKRVAERNTPESEERLEERMPVSQTPCGPSHLADQSLTTWETMRPSSSPPPDSSLMEDELQYPSPFVTSTPLPGQHNPADSVSSGVVADPLFVLTESQLPFPYSQWQDTQIDYPNGSEIQDEEEVAMEVRNLRSPSSASTTLGPYRKLSDIASQTNFPTSSLIKTPKFGPPSKATLDDLYGLSQREEEEESTSGTDSDTAVQSHIPASRRAGILAKASK